MTATIATHHLALARHARDAGRLADVISNATTAWGIANAEKQPAVARDAISTIARAHYAREEPDEARRWYSEALEYAKAHNLVLGVAHAAHDLYLSALACGRTEEAHRAHATAWTLYDFRGARVSALVADRSMETMEMDPGYAYHAWRAFESESTERRDRVYALANMVTAVSHFTTDGLFDTLWPTLRALLNTEMERAAMLYAVAAEDLCRKDRREESFEIAQRAVAIAEARGEGVVRERAEHALDCANSARVPPHVL
jgi:tetratricopeptide (TPR) repeat protein